MAGAFLTRCRLFQLLAYSLMRPLTTRVPGLASSGCMARTADLWARRVFGLYLSRAMRAAMYSMYVAVVHGTATRPISAHHRSNMPCCERRLRSVFCGLDRLSMASAVSAET